MLMINQVVSILQGLHHDKARVVIQETLDAFMDRDDRDAKRDLFVDEDGWTDDEGAAPGVIDRPAAQAGSMRLACAGHSDPLRTP
ncbi:MAG: hypothetical protein Q7J48_15855 [Nocardioides sp.]|nr:hypothetical protein [Nocardioides sp.]